MKADIVLKGNNIFTGQGDAPISGGIAIVGNKIDTVIEGDGIDSYIGDNTKVYDMGDKLIMPGFVDAHLHLFCAACFASPYMVDVTDAHSPEELADMVKEFADANPDYPFISGGGWLPAHWDNPEYPLSPELLDKAVPDRPVYTFASDYHTMWLNKKALEESGITKDDKVSFGSYGLNEEGELTGVLFDFEAMAPAFNRAYALSKDQMKVEIGRAHV